MDEDGAFKTAARGGRWSEWKQMLAEATNNSYRMLAAYLAFHSTEDNDLRFDPKDFYFLDPREREIAAELERQEAEQASKTEPELAEAGWM